MNKSLLIRVVTFTILTLLISEFVMLPGCAVQSPPLGGPRDSIPAVLITAKPPDSSRNNIPKRIVLEFNEYVQLDNPTENVLISPVPKINPNMEVRLRTVVITMRDTLEPNTTYAIDFGKSLRDLNESNVTKNLRYIFSTGDVIDSLQVRGKVIMAESGKTDSTLIAALYKNPDDSAVAKEKPRYIARLDNQGNFNFKNLPPGTYALYAFKDEGGSKRYMSKSQLFAFADKPVNVSDTTPVVTLYAYVEEKEKPLAPASGVGGRQPAGKAAAQDKRLRIETNVTNNELDLLGNLNIFFRPVPLKTLDTTKIFLLNRRGDTISGYHFDRDTGNTRVSLVHKWLPDSSYTVILDKDFATDTSGKKLLRTDTLSFKVKRESEYGLVRLRFLNLDLGKNPVLLFVQNDEVKYTHVFTSREFYTRLFAPGEYELRILFDDNKNGRWDPGSFFGKHLQPERVMPVSRTLNVKANWDNEVDINL